MNRKPTYGEIDVELLCLAATKVMFWWLEDVNDTKKKHALLHQGQCMAHQIFAILKGWA